MADTTIQLLEACEAGNMEAVRVLVEERGVDVNATTTYSNLKRASPLFVAAENCKLEIVQYLIGKDANVHSRTSTDANWISPLHASISLRYDLQFHERKPVIELLIANGADTSALTGKGSPMWLLCNKEPALTMLLVNLGMSLSPRSPDLKITEGRFPKSKTILHHWVTSPDENAVSVVELLLAKGADLKALDYWGLTPLNAAVIGYYNGIGYYNWGDSYEDPNEPVLRHLLQRQEISLLEKIEALELAGAMMLLEKEDDVSVFKAFQYWNDALDLRESGQESILKVSLNISSNVHWRATEWTTRDQLLELRHRPFAEMKIQAILVATRILSQIGVRRSMALERYLWGHFLCNYYPNRLSEQLEICWIMLEGARVTDICVGYEIFHRMIIGIIDHIWLSLRKLKTNQNPIFNSETLKFSLELISDRDMLSYLDKSDDFKIFNGSMLDSICKFVTFLCESPEMMTQEIKSGLHRFIKEDQQDPFGDQLLLHAVDQQQAADTQATVRLLLDAGANPNAKNGEGNSPLHLIAKWIAEKEKDSPIAHLLLEYGAHIDEMNDLNQTPLDVWNVITEKRGKIVSPPDWMNVVPPLACLCARIVRHGKAPYDHLPEGLCKFVTMH